MFRIKSLLFVVFSTSTLSAQISGIVKDSLTKKPIPYVNIWVENENSGTTSTENGLFELNINDEKRIVFSALGFENKTIASSKTKNVLLNPKIYELNEVIVENLKNTKELEIGGAKKIHHSQLSGDKPWIYGKLFDYEEQYSETPYIKKVIFYSNSDIKNAKLKIRIFEMNDSIPSNDLLYEEIIITVKKGMKKNSIDVSQNNIKFSKKGVVVGLEWLIIDENKYNYEYKESKIKKSFVTYAPSLVINYEDFENSFRYSGGKWIRSKKYDSKQNKPWDNKVLTPAINLLLTN